MMNKLYKLLILTFIFLFLLTNISTALNNTEHNNKTNNPTNPIYLQSAYICSPNNLTNNDILGECLTFTIYGLDNIDENLNNNDYIYDENLKINWLNQGISLHLIFHNESYDLGIANISYGEYIDVENKIISYLHNNGNNRTTYYIGESFIQVRITNGTILNESYYYANNKLLAKNISGEMLYNHPDHLGSTTLVTNQSGGIVEEEFYLPFGDTLEGSEESRYLFNAKELDKLTSLYYYGARYYSTIPKQFIQPDTVILDIYNPQDLNRYAYVRNNPYKYTDSTGNYVETALDIGFIIYDINELRQEQSLTNYIALGLDVAGAALPFATGLGAGFKVAKGIDKVSDVADVAKAGEKVGDVSKTVETAIDKIKETKLSDLPQNVQDTINKIQQGKTEGLRPHEFKNKEGILPKKESSYYTTHDVTNKNNPERIITGKNRETYYTDKHYEKGSFSKVIDKIKDILRDSKKK